MPPLSPLTHEVRGDPVKASPTLLAAKEYKNQQPQQLISTTFRGPTPSAAKKNTTHGVNRYINPLVYDNHVIHIPRLSYAYPLGVVTG